MTTYSWEKKESAGSWVPFEGTPTAEHPTEEFSEGTWDVRLTVSEGGQTGQETKKDYITVTASEPAYTGPLDLYSTGAVCGYGMRALSAARLGQNLFRLSRDSDNAEMDFVADPDFATWEGGPDMDDLSAWIGAATPTMVTIYDQVGSSDITDPVFFSANYSGGRPAASLHAAAEPVNYVFGTGAFLFLAVSVEGAFEFNVTGSEGSEEVTFESHLTGGASNVFASDVDGVNMAGGEFDGSGTDPNPRVSTCGWEFGSRAFKVNNTASNQVDVYDDGASPGSITVTSLNLNSVVAQEIIGWASNPSAGTILSLTQNAATYYSVPIA